MNILQIYDGYSKVEPKGSVPSVVFYLSKALAQMGHNVTIVERKSLDSDKCQEYVEGIKFIRFKARKLATSGNEVLFNFPFNLIRVVVDGLLFACRVGNWLKKEGKEFDIIHLHLPFACTIIAFFNRKLRSKMVYTFHGDVYRLNLQSRVRVPWYVRLISPDLFLMRRVRKVVVLNQALCSNLAVTKKVSSQNVTAIGNGVDINIYRPNIDSENIKLKFAIEGKVVILFAGTIFPRKGVELLIKAADALVNRFNYQNLSFLLAGDLTLDKEYVNRISGYVQELGLGETVRMVGSVPHTELVKLYVASDLFVCPSPEEPWGLVVTEAMACGKPVIGTRVGGMLMQIRDGWNGFLVEPDNEVDMAEKIKYLIDHPEERLRMGTNSRKRAEEEFSWEKVAEKYIKVYQEVLK